MKKLLYTTSALVGAAFLMEAVAPAKAEVNMSLRYRAALMSQSLKDEDKKRDGLDSLGANGKKHRSTTLSSNLVHIGISGSKDHPNGLTTSASIELETRDNSGTAGGQTDGLRFKNSFGSVAGSFGKVDVGYFHDVAYRTLGSGTPGTANFGVSDAWNQPAGVFINASATGDIGGRSSSIAYWSPSFSGAQIGVSWSPQLDKNGRNSGFVSEQDDLEDSLAFVASYSGSFGGTGVSMAVGMEQAKVVSKKAEPYGNGSGYQVLLSNGKSATSATAIADDTRFSRQNQDPTAYAGYISFDIGQFTVGGSYSNREEEAANAGNTKEHTIMALGASYTVDALTFGIGYAQQDTDVTDQTVRTSSQESGAVSAANHKDSAAYKETLTSDVLAFTVDYALGDGANIDFVIEQANAEERIRPTATRAIGKREKSSSGFGIGIDLKF